MKKYQSHKVVEAAQIVMHTDGRVVVSDGPGHEEVVIVPADFGARGEPSNGDYLVRYQPDGYLSWSPRAVFEAGYKLVDQPAPGDTWQSRAMDELEQLNKRLDGLRRALLAGSVKDQHALSLMQRQYKAMDEYAYTLMARLRYLGVIDTETPPTVRETPAGVEVTVRAPAGKRAVVKMFHTDGYDGPHSTPWTVTEGQTQAWTLVGGEVLTISQASTSTVAHKRPAE